MEQAGDREGIAPDGSVWAVHIDWVARRVRNPLRRSIAAARDARATRRARRREKRGGDRESDGGGDWGSSLDALGFVDDLGWAVLIAVVVVALGFLFVWVAPALWAVVVILVEFFVFTIAAIGVLVWRTLLRRPWRVVATRSSDSASRTVDVVGYRAARRVARDLSEHLSRGGHVENFTAAGR